MKRGFLIVAVGSNVYGNMAMNLCLSIRANENWPCILVCTASAIKGIEDYVQRYFYKVIIVKKEGAPMWQASKLKLQAYDYANGILDECILLDADVMVLPGKNIGSWFEQKLDFVAYYHSVYNYKEGKADQPNAHFWCDPEKFKSEAGIYQCEEMPQVNASWIYFNRKASAIFSHAIHFWKEAQTKKWRKKYGIVDFRGFVNEEFGFNAALTYNFTPLPAIPHTPLYMQVYSDIVEEDYITHRFKGFALSGDIQHDPKVVSLYNRLSDYYRGQFGIRKKFYFEQHKKFSIVSTYIDPTKTTPHQEQVNRETLLKKKIAVCVIVYNRFENVKRWIRIWQKCDQLGARLVIIHNYDSVADSERYANYCNKFGVKYVGRPNKGYDIGAFQDLVRGRLQGFDVTWDILFWATDDTVPMDKDFLYQYASRALRKDVGLVCQHVSSYVKLHARTTGLCMRYDVATRLMFPADPVSSKDHCYDFEHRGNAILNQVEAMGLKVIMPIEADKAYTYDLEYYKHGGDVLPERTKEHELLFPPFEDDKVTFICTVYNTFPEIVSSLICQTHKNWELLLLHDGPNKTGIRKFINAVGDKRIKFIESKERKQLWGHPLRQWALNEIKEGRLSKPDYIVITNSDNYHVPVYCEYLLGGFKDGVQATYCDKFVHAYQSPQPKSTGETVIHQWGTIETKLERGYIDCACVMATKEAACAVGWRDVETHSSDWTYFSDIMNKYGIQSFNRVYGTLVVHN